MVFRDARRSAIVLLLLLSVVFAGCAPKPPLDWRVKASSLNAYNAWMRDYGPELGETLQAEFAVATHNLALMTPSFRMPKVEKDMSRAGNPFCERIDGKTVREILIDYYLADNERTLGTINLNLDAITRLYKRSSENEDTRAERSIPYYEKQIEADREKLRRNGERLKQLRGESRPSSS